MEPHPADFFHNLVSLLFSFRKRQPLVVDSQSLLVIPKHVASPGKISKNPQITWAQLMCYEEVLPPHFLLQAESVGQVTPQFMICRRGDDVRRELMNSSLQLRDDLVFLASHSSHQLANLSLRWQQTHNSRRGKRFRLNGHVRLTMFSEDAHDMHNNDTLCRMVNVHTNR